MKTLLTYINDIAVLTPLKEGLLQGQNATLQHDNPWREVYPVPTIKDFIKTSAGPGGRVSQYRLKWVCPELLKSELSKIEIYNQNQFFNKDDAHSIEIIIQNQVPEVYLLDSNRHSHRLYGVGFGTGARTPQLKKDCIEFLNAIADDPEVIVKCVKCNNDNHKMVEKKYKANYRTFKEIINKY